ncbi:EamA family transporter, partial [Thermodesulfobacteriota bacterium]
FFWWLQMRSFSYVDPQTGSMISMGAVVLIFWLLSPFLLKAGYFQNVGMWVFIGNGFVHPLFSMYLAFEATKRMGPTISATISAVAPLFAAAGAALTLGETITFHILMGTVGTVIGIMVLSWNRQGAVKWALPSLMFPIGAAIIRGANHNIGKFGLQLLPSPYFAALVSFTVSFSGALLIYYYRVRTLPLNIPKGGLIWSGLSGLCIATGVLAMYSALSSGLVSIVSPIVATFPLFTLIIGLVFRQETLNLRLFIGVIMVVGCVVWISIQ